MFYFEANREQGTKKVTKLKKALPWDLKIFSLGLSSNMDLRVSIFETVQLSY